MIVGGWKKRRETSEGGDGKILRRYRVSHQGTQADDDAFPRLQVGQSRNRTVSKRNGHKLTKERRYGLSLSEPYMCPQGGMNV